MPASLVEKNSTTTALDDHRQSTRRRWASLQLGHCLTRCTCSKFFHVVKIEEFKPNSATHGVVPGLHSPIARGNNTHPKKGTHLVVGSKDALTVCHQNTSHTVAIARRYLYHCLVDTSRCFICAFQQFNFARLRNFIWQNLYIVDSVRIDTTESHRHHTTRSLFGCNCGCLGCLKQPGFREVGCVGKARCFTVNDPNASPPVTPRCDLLNTAIVEPRRRGSLVFNEDLGEPCSCAAALSQHLFYGFFANKLAQCAHDASRYLPEPLTSSSWQMIWEALVLLARTRRCGGKRPRYLLLSIPSTPGPVINLAQTASTVSMSLFRLFAMPFV